jgi:MFS family permease
MLAAVLASLSTFVIVYVVAVFTLSWGTTVLGYSRSHFLVLQLFGMLFFAATIPISALIAERGRRRIMIGVTVAIMIFGLGFGPLFLSGSTGTAVMMAIGLSLTGLTYGPLGTVLAELFPTQVRYTASSLSFSLAGILGGSVAPYIATWLAQHHGLPSVGYYLSASGLLTMIGLMMIPETRDTDLSAAAMPVLD